MHMKPRLHSSEQSALSAPKESSQKINLPNQEELDSLSQRSLENVPRFVSTVQKMRELNAPLSFVPDLETLLQTLPLPLDQVVHLSQVWEQAYQEAVIKERARYSPTDTVQGYYLEDMRKNPYEFVSQEMYPELGTTTDALWQSIWMMQRASQMIENEFQWSVVVPKTLESLGKEFSIESLEATRELLDISTEVFFKFMPFMSDAEWDLLSQKPWKNPELQTWVQKHAENDDVKEFLGEVSNSVDRRVIQFLFHRYFAVGVAGVSSEKQREYILQLLQESDDEKEVRSFYQSSGFEVALAGFKLHVRGKLALSDPSIYQVIEKIRDFCKARNMCWKLRIPTDPSSESFRSFGDSRYDGTFITIWPAKKDDVEVISEESLQQEWEEMILLGKEIDQLVSEYPCPDSVRRAKTDWLVQSEEKTSNRVQIRFGTNTGEADEVARYIGKQRHWQDSREASFEENLPLFEPSSLVQSAQSLGVKVTPFS